MTKYFVEIIRTYSAEIEVDAVDHKDAAKIAEAMADGLDFLDTNSPDEYAVIGPDGETVFHEGTNI